ncbi:hypothetical protein [Variovorax sp. PAMC 28711]|uniref:hypothetical protein n=1 Tax=Variovorax sp. PAMC 28711 TaxID=1795631 RepID=UPI00078D4AA8|nr:hypothetical protein [Variovorax sp. PAMC 28711]AMM25084.1 hypothetical protein AX767_12455 [Variovorax sp. PAMC 28711]
MNTRRTLMLGATMGLLDFLGLNQQAAAMGPRPAPTAADPLLRNGGWPQGAAAQLIAGNVITPLRHIGYPADWFLDQLLALEPEDLPPKSFRATAPATDKLYTYANRYTSDLAESYSLPVSYFNQTVEGYHMFLWNGVKMKGLQVVTALPESLTPQEVQKIWNYAYLSYGNVSKPTLTSAPGLSGWNGLAAAWSLIATPEAKAVWLTSSDALSRPKDEQPNESGVQLIVGHPAYESGRKPLAYFTAPVTVKNDDAKPSYLQERKRIAALREAAEQVCAAAGIDPKTVGTVMRDSGRGSREAAARLSDTTAALHSLMPNLDLVQNMLDMSSLLGDLGASTVNYSLLMAAFACHERKHPVLYLSSRDPEAARAALVLPSPDYSVTDAARRGRAVTYGKQTNRPWWGERKDGKADY